MKYNKEWLIGKFKRKEGLKYLFFWGHQPSKDGTITKSCFSQWWIASFEIEGNSYPSAEHYMMFQKALLFADSEVAARILKAKSPAEAKKLGRLVKNFSPTLWDMHKYDIVVTANYHKFKQHEALRNFLLTTAERILVEASPVDAIWGIGLSSDDERAGNPLSWKGENLLGFALMEVRDKLK